MTAEAPGAVPWASHARRLALCVGYIVVSASLIRFNKYLMDAERFPFSMALTAIHMTVSSACCCMLYAVKPSFFPGMANAQGKRLLVFKWFAPIGLAFAISLYASNQAYMYCNVTFLQFLKEANVIVIFLMSCAVGLQVMNRVRCAVIVWVIAGSSLAVTGELHFVMIGFLFQVVSQFAECSRAVMGEYVLNGGGLKLDPMSYTMFVAPTCLLVLLVGNAFSWDPAIPHRLAHWWPVLLPNALLAFLLNVLVAATIKEASAVGFILTGVVKDIVVVLFSAMFFHETVTPVQLLAFMVTLGGVFFWSYLRIAPDSPAVKWVETAMGLPKADPKVPDETTSLVSNKA